MVESWWLLLPMHLGRIMGRSVVTSRVEDSVHYKRAWAWLGHPWRQYMWIEKAAKSVLHIHAYSHCTHGEEHIVQVPTQ